MSMSREKNTKKINLNVDVHHLTRVEGHGNIKVRVTDGKLAEARWDIVETPRFFEVMLKGKHYTAAGILTARICGICSIGHCLASVRATENAFGITVPEAAAKLRLLAKHGETLQSHVLHLFFLAAPDFLGLPSAIPLKDLKPEVFALAARLKGLANRICDVVAGRTTHPVSIQVGGMAKMPDKHVLAGAEIPARTRRSTIWRRPSSCSRTLEIPDFVRETEFVSLKGERDYPFIGGRLLSTDGVEQRRVRLPGHDQRVRDREQHVEVVQALSRVVRRRGPGPAQQQLPPAAPQGQGGGRPVRPGPGLPQPVHEQRRPVGRVRARGPRLDPDHRRAARRRPQPRRWPR